MPERAMRFETPVLLVGGGPVDPAMLAAARARTGAIVAADQGADRLARLGAVPDAILGDLDSLADPAGWRARGVAVRRIAEQDTTDFEKCLYATEAPHYLALGFTGGRMDHTLAVFHAMLRRPEKPVVLIGEVEAMALLPPGRALRVAVGEGARVSIFPLAECRGIVSEGLAWPVAGLAMAPGRQIGTSNRATAPSIAVGFDRPGALLMLDRGAFPELLGALLEAVAAGPAGQPG